MNVPQGWKFAMPSATSEITAAFIKEAAAEAQEIRQESQAASVKGMTEDETSLVVSLRRSSKTLGTERKKTDKTQKTDKKPKILMPKEELSELANNFQQRRGFPPGLDPDILIAIRMNLGQRLKPGANREEILAAVRAAVLDFYGSDPAMAAEAFEFLLETTRQPEGSIIDPELAKVHEAVKEVKDKYGSEEEKGKDIRAGRNIIGTLREFVDKGHGTAESFRTLYKKVIDIPSEQWDMKTLYETLVPEGTSWKKAFPLNSFLMRSMAEDAKREGPTIDPLLLTERMAELQKTRVFISMHRFFGKRCEGEDSLVAKQFDRIGE